jgi:signal transduction histidine kinase
VVATFLDVTAEKEARATLSHKLRDPLGPIVTSLAHMVAAGSGPLEQDRTVIEREVKHLSQLLDDLLDVPSGVNRKD